MPDLDYMAVKCRPFEMVKEFCSILIIAGYIPPRDNAELVLEELYCLISKQVNLNPEAAVIVAGDFNHVLPKSVLPKFRKFTFPPETITYWIRFIATSQGVTWPRQPPNMDMSDHVCVELIPAY